MSENRLRTDGVDPARLDSNMRTEHPDGRWQWLEAASGPLQVAGLPGFEAERIYRRLPFRVPAPLPEAVIRLAGCTAGGQLRFRTDSPRLSVRVKLGGPASMDHMPSTGQCGFDAYIGPIGSMRYAATARPGLGRTEYESLLWDEGEGEREAREADESSGMRDITLNFPLYQSVEQVWVGVRPGSAVEPPHVYATERRVVIYGTSITQGGCASRPGMAYSNILSRRVPLEFINLGFSGNGKGEPEVAMAIREIPRQACLLLDYEANCTTGRYCETLEPFIRLYREACAEVPILVVSRIPYAAERSEKQKNEWNARREWSMSVVARLREEGDRHIRFVDGSQLLGERWDECTVDGVHPNDYGFMRMADSLEPFLKEALADAGIAW
jgi:hypothetical protein